MKVITPSIGLKIPGPKSYMMAELYAVGYEDEVPLGEEDATRRARRSAQLADLRGMLQQLPALFEEAMRRPEADVIRPTPPSVAPADQMVPVQGPTVPPPSARSAYPPVEQLTPMQRVCSNQSVHKPSEPRPIASNEYEFSVSRYSRPLCRACQAQATPIQRRA